MTASEGISRCIEGRFDGKGQARIALLAARFNDFIVNALIGGAEDALRRHGVPAANVSLVRVPGAFEMPVAAAGLVQRADVDAVIALGAVIRGSTPHFDYVAGSCVRGLAQVAERSGKPVILGVLTTDTIEQAIERAGTKAGNKGFEAAVSALEMVDLMRQLAQ